MVPRLLLTLTDARNGRVWSDLVTADVSATGLAFTAPRPHGLRLGDRFEVRLLAQTEGRTEQESMVLSTEATLVRADETGGALAFDGPLRY